MLNSILGCIAGYLLGLIICLGIKAVMRLITKNETSADGATAIVLLSILITTLIFICILG